MCKSRFDIRWLAVAIFSTAATVILTHLPQETIPPAFRASGVDKLEHALAYGAIMALFLVGLRTSPTVSAMGRLFLVVAAIAALDELTQGLVSRTPSILDFAADVLGMSSMVVLYTWWSRSLRRRIA